MDKTRKRLLFCLIAIFVVTSIAFVSALFGDKLEITGSIVNGDASNKSIFNLYMPGLLFIGLIILSIYYLEKS